MKTIRLRRILVILQFSITILLITGTVIMHRQIRYMVKKDLGFNKEQLLVISRTEAMGNRNKSLKEKPVESSGNNIFVQPQQAFRVIVKAEAHIH